MLTRLRGYRTLAVFSPIFLLALLEGIQAIDLTPIFTALHVSDANRSTIVCVVSLLAVVMRVWTTTPVGRSPGTDNR